MLMVRSVFCAIYNLLLCLLKKNSDGQKARMQDLQVTYAGAKHMP